jgi:Zn-dependent protease
MTAIAEGFILALNFAIFKNILHKPDDMFITPLEIFDMLLMIAVIGFIFMNTFKSPVKEGDLSRYLKKSRFNWDDFWFAAMVTAPAIILHEMGHKITALSFGLNAEFHAAYIWLIAAIVLKLVNFPFIFFVPAYVTISGNANIIQQTIVAFAGPGVNLLLFIIALIVIKTQTLKGIRLHFWILTKNINLFLLIFNLLPIPGFDGFTVFSGLWKIIGL